MEPQLHCCAGTPQNSALARPREAHESHCGTGRRGERQAAEEWLPRVVTEDDVTELHATLEPRQWPGVHRIPGTGWGDWRSAVALEECGVVHHRCSPHCDWAILSQPSSLNQQTVDQRNRGNQDAVRGKQPQRARLCIKTFSDELVWSENSNAGISYLFHHHSSHRSKDDEIGRMNATYPGKTSHKTMQQKKAQRNSPLVIPSRAPSGCTIFCWREKEGK